MEPSLAIITALPKEHAAATRLLIDPKPITVPDDPTLYTTGLVPGQGGNHSVILACLSKYANNPAAVTTTNLIRSFPSVRDIVFVGIAAGVPRPDKPDAHVRLGDIVVSSGAGVIQFDIGARKPTNFEIRNSAPPPSAQLLQAANLLESQMLVGQFSWAEYIAEFLLRADVVRPIKEPSKPFRHPSDPQRHKGVPRVFRGKIGASNTLMKSASHRDAIAISLGILAIEMEGSGVADATWEAKVGYLLVRSACDYGDEGKSDSWQEYAAHAAAAYLGALFTQLPITISQKQHYGRLPLKTPERIRRPDVYDRVFSTQASSNRLTCCTWLGDGASVAAGGFTGEIYFGKENSNEVTTLHVGDSIIRCIETVLDQKFLIIGDDAGRLVLVNPTSHMQQEVGRTNSSVFSVSDWPEKRILYTSERNGSVVEWAYDQSSGMARRLRVVHRHEGPAFEVHFDVHSQTCLSVGGDGFLLGTNLETGKLASRAISKAALFTFALRAQCRVAGDSSGKFFVGRVGSKAYTALEGHTDSVRKVDLSLEGKWACTASKDGTLRLWNLLSSRSWIVAQSRNYLYDVRFSPSNSAILACDGGGELLLVQLDRPVDELSPKALDTWCATNCILP